MTHVLDKKDLTVLLIGSGGREHVIAHQIAKSQRCEKLYIAPGNPGTFQCGENVDVSGDNIPELLTFVKNNDVDITFVGPEQPLALGIVDVFQTEGLAIVGPNKIAAQLESSKAWAKKKYADYGMPTADYAEFSDVDAAIQYVTEKNMFPIVIKADGLAAGKGVTIATSLEMATKALQDCLVDAVFKDAGSTVVIEDFLEGEEASLFAFTDGKTVVPMVSAQDHKAIFDNDKGPNTGGMGAYSPAPVVTDAVQQKVMDRILNPLVEGFARDGIDYCGILYAGLMINKAGDPYVVEFNIRFGDPETQIVLPKLETDILDIFVAMHNKTLHALDIEWSDVNTVCIVMASEGYPGSYPKGKAITGIHASSDTSTWVYHAGTKQTDKGEYVTNGGRVLNVCAEAATLQQAIDAAYARCKTISFDGAYYRSDIGQKGVARLAKPVA
jgi:phosphoribosylamine---glycine ligase